MKWFFSREQRLPVVEGYIASTPRAYPKKRPVEELRFLVIDTETTGFNIHRDKILSFAGVDVRGDRIDVAAMHDWMLYQEDMPVTAAAEVHGILPSDTKSGLPEASMMDELLPVLNGAIIVGHHVQFDASLLNNALLRRFRIELRNPTLDTAVLAMRALEAFAKTGYANQHPPTLDEVCTHLGIPMIDRHTAAGDAFTTAELFLVLCARLRQRLKRPLLAGDLPIQKY